MSHLHFQPIFGVDISDSSIEILCLRKSEWRRPELFSYNRMILPFGVVQDGVILQSEALSEALKRMLETSKPHWFHSALCCVSLPDSQVFITFLHFPSSLKGEDLRQAVLYELETSYPLRISDHYFDFTVVKKDSLFQEALVVVAPKHLIHNYVEALHVAGFLPLCFDIESLSISRALLRPSDMHNTIMIVDVGARYTNVSVYRNNTPCNILLVPHGGDAMTRNIASALNCSIIEAELCKRKCHLFSKVSNPEVHFAIESELKKIIFELKRIIQNSIFVHKQEVDTIIVAGGCALMPGVRKFFQSHFRQNVEIRNPLKLLDVSEKDRKNRRFIFFSNVIGLALRGISEDPVVGEINLLQKARVYT